MQKWGKEVTCDSKSGVAITFVSGNYRGWYKGSPLSWSWHQATYIHLWLQVTVSTIGQNQDDQWFAFQGQGYGVVSSPEDLFLLCRAGCPRHILKRCDRLSPISTFSDLIFFHSARIFFSLALSLSDGFLWLCLWGVARAFTVLFYDA